MEPHRVLGRSPIELVTAVGAPRREARLDALAALIATPVPGAWPALVEATFDDDAGVRRLALEALAALRVPADWPPYDPMGLAAAAIDGAVVGALWDADPAAQAAAIDACVARGLAHVVPILAGLAGPDRPLPVRTAAREALAGFRARAERPAA